MGKQLINTGKGNQTVNTNNVWDRIVALEEGSTSKATKEELGVLSTSLTQKANKKNNIVYVSDLIAENPTTPIATLINQLFVNNKTTGIKVIVDIDITINSTLTMQNNCILEGTTRRTQIKLGNASNCDMINWNYSIKAFVRNITLNGNKDNNSTGNGIVCGNNSQPENLAIVDGSLIENVHIWECVEDGLKVIYPIWSMSFNRVTIGYCNGYGLYNTGTDNFFNEIYILGCGKTTAKPVGMWFYGSNNKISNSKIIFSGLANEPTSVGIRISGANQQITNVEAQENLRAGIYLYYVKNSNISILSDANADKVPHVAGVGYGVQMTGCEDNVFNINTTNFSYSQGYYQDVELIIGSSNARNTITFRYDTPSINIPLKDTSSTPDDYNVVNGYSLITYMKLYNIKKSNGITQPIPNSSTYWSLNGGITAVSGLITATTANQDIGKLLSFTGGRVYLARIDFTSKVGNWLFRAEEQVTYSSPTQYTFGNSTHMIINQTTTGNRNLLFRCISASGSVQVEGIALLDITDEYVKLKDYYGDGTIGRMLATDGITSTVTL